MTIMKFHSVSGRIQFPIFDSSTPKVSKDFLNFLYIVSNVIVKKNIQKNFETDPGHTPTLTTFSFRYTMKELWSEEECRNMSKFNSKNLSAIP